MKITLSFHQRVQGLFPNLITYCPEDEAGNYYSGYTTGLDPVSGIVIYGTVTWDRDGNPYKGPRKKRIVAWAYEHPEDGDSRDCRLPAGFDSYEKASEICRDLNHMLAVEEKAHWLPDPSYDFEVMNWTRT